MFEPRPGEGIGKALDVLLPGPLTREYNRNFNWQEIPKDDPSTLAQRLHRRGVYNLGLAVGILVGAPIAATVFAAVGTEILVAGGILFLASLARMGRRFTQAQSI